MVAAESMLVRQWWLALPSLYPHSAAGMKARLRVRRMPVGVHVPQVSCCVVVLSDPCRPFLYCRCSLSACPLRFFFSQRTLRRLRMDRPCACAWKCNSVRWSGETERPWSRGRDGLNLSFSLSKFYCCLSGCCKRRGARCAHACVDAVLRRHAPSFASHC